MNLSRQLLPGSLTFFVFFYALVSIFVDKQSEGIKNNQIQFYTEAEQLETYPQILYYNDFTHFKILIPKSWKVQEEKLDNGSILFTLSSPDSSIIIQNRRVEEQDGIKMINNREAFNVGSYEAHRNTERVGNKVINRLVVSDTHQRGVVFNVITDEDILETSPILNNIFKSFAYTQKEPTIKEFFSYNLPEDWTEEYNEKYGILSLNSSDFSPTHADVISGISVSLQKQLRQPDFTFESIVKQAKEPTLGYIEIIEETSIDNNRALFTFGSYEGTRLGYRFIVNNDIWNITIWCSQCNTPEQYLASGYRAVVDEFIDSIQFNYD